MYIADVFGVWNIVQVLNYTEELFMTLWLPYVYISQRLKKLHMQRKWKMANCLQWNRDFSRMSWLF